MNEVVAIEAGPDGAPPRQPGLTQSVEPHHIAPEPIESQPGEPRRGDLTQGPILQTLLAFSIPTLIANVLQTLNGSVNAVWVGRLIGAGALAATANASMLMFLLFATTFGFGMATTVRVGQYFGAHDLAGARMSFGSGIGFSTGLAVATSVVGWQLAPQLLVLLKTPAASYALALAYLKVVFISVPFSTMSLMVSVGLRGTGDSKTPLYAMILTVAIDIVCNPLLIVGLGPFPRLGIAGSALSLGVANVAGLAWMIWTIYRRDLPLRLRGSELGYLIPRRDDLGYIVAKGLPMGAQMLLVSSAGLVMIGLVNREGLNAAAAYGASLQLWNFLQMPALAIASAVSAMVAQSIGAGNHRRVSAVTLIGIAVACGMSLVIAALIVGFDRPLLALFLGGHSPAMPVAQHIQLVCTASFVIVAATMILMGTLRAYGVVVVPLIVMALALYPGRLGFYAFAHPRIGGDAVWWAFPVGSGISAVLIWLFYMFGRWQPAVVLPTHARVAG